MKRMLFGVCLLSLAGCVSSPDTTFTQATPGCKAATAEVNGKPVATQFCIKTIAFQPSQYRVTVNDQVLFTGTDYQRVAFTKTIKEGSAKGACNELIELQGAGSKTVPLNELPTELVAGCRITADAAGNSQAFSKDAACDKAFYKSLTPLLGKVIPVEVARQCTVTVAEQPVFDQRFNF
jgi:plastocyanin